MPTQVIFQPNYLENAYINQRMTMSAIANEVGCSPVTVLNHLRKLNIPTRTFWGMQKIPKEKEVKPGSNWTPIEQLRLIELYANYSNIELMEFFPHRTQISIQHAGNRINLHKSPETRERIINESASKAWDSWRKPFQITTNGYVIIHIPVHPLASKDGYVMQHRLVMEEHLGRYLSHEEIVHHRNGIKNDNEIENLEVMTNAEHTTMHNIGRKHNSATISRMSEIAKSRLSDKRNHPNYKDISIEQLKNAYLERGSVEGVCEVFGICRKTFYNKIEDFKLEEWYSNVK